MKYSLALAAMAASLVSGEYTRCATPNPSEEHIAILNAAVEEASNRTFSIQALRNVDTYVHVVTTSAKAGQYSQSQVNEQISVMNDAYAPLNVQFNLLDTTFTTNNQWAAASDGSTAEYNMKSALHQGSYDTLNLYFLSDLGGGLLGFCYFPEASPSSQDRILDGCINLADSLPGGSATNYDLGLTAVHETGHWFGLYHVFQGSACSGAGDSVSDTPIQRTATSGCPASQDSCPNQSGVDSIHNFMDYSYDSCMYEFTSGQVTRATSLFDQLRAGK